MRTQVNICANDCGKSVRSDASRAVFDLNTLQADKDLVATSYNAVSMYYNGDIDPITGEPVSLVTKERALLVIAAFEIVVTEKELRN